MLVKQENKERENSLDLMTVSERFIKVMDQLAYIEDLESQLSVLFSTEQPILECSILEKLCFSLT